MTIVKVLIESLNSSSLLRADKDLILRGGRRAGRLICSYVIKNFFLKLYLEVDVGMLISSRDGPTTHPPLRYSMSLKKFKCAILYMFYIKVVKVITLCKPIIMCFMRPSQVYTFNSSSCLLITCFTEPHLRSYAHLRILLSTTMSHLLIYSSGRAAPECAS